MELIKKVSEHYQQLLGFSSRRTKLQTLGRGEWKEFCERWNLNHDSEGIFLPRNLTAYTLNSENLLLNVFHEYFGHGLFCEYAKQGKFLEKLERRLKKEERMEFRGRSFSLQELNDFRKNNPNFRLIEQERKSNLYEIFAIWTEHYLSRLFGGDFEKKYKDMPQEARESLEKLIEFQKNHGELSLFYETGMPKYYDADKARIILERVLKDKTKSVKLALVYGSRKPYSDMDFFVVSNEIGNFSNEWLDIYTASLGELEYGVSVFDVSFISPLLTGDFLFGDKQYLEQKRRQFREQPITQEAIYYNLIKSKEQSIMAERHPRNSREYRIGKGYAETYRKNALNLSRGKRSILSRFSQS